MQPRVNARTKDRREDFLPFYRTNPNGKFSVLLRRISRFRFSDVKWEKVNSSLEILWKFYYTRFRFGSLWIISSSLVCFIIFDSQNLNRIERVFLIIHPRSIVLASRTVFNFCDGIFLLLVRLCFCFSTSLKSQILSLNSSTSWSCMWKSN